MDQAPTVKMASRVEQEVTFVKSAMAAVEVEHARYLKSNPNGGKSCIAVPTDAYESLLHEAFHGLPLSILSKDNTAKPVRYDPAKQVFFANHPQDRRLLVPMNVICREIGQRKQEGTPFGALTSVGAEMMRQIETHGLGGATLEPELFQHNANGK